MQVLATASRGAESQIKKLNIFVPYGSSELCDQSEAHLLLNRGLNHSSLGIQPFCGRRSTPSPGHNKLLTKYNLCCGVGACDITSSPGAVWDLGQAQALCVSRAQAPCTRVLDHPAMSPLLSTGRDALPWHSHTMRYCGRNILHLS